MDSKQTVIGSSPIAFGDLAIAIAAVLPSKLDNIGGETLLVLTTARDLALRRAMLPERRTGATLGDMQLRSHLLNAGTAPPRGLLQNELVQRQIRDRLAQLGSFRAQSLRRFTCSVFSPSNSWRHR